MKLTELDKQDIYNTIEDFLHERITEEIYNRIGYESYHKQLFYETVGYVLGVYGEWLFSIISNKDVECVCEDIFTVVTHEMKYQLKLERR